MVSEHLFYSLLAFLIVSCILNIFQYVTICGLQAALDVAEDNCQLGIRKEDQLRQDLRAARQEAKYQRHRADTMPQPLRSSDPLFDAVRKAREGVIQPVDHVHAAVMAGHTGMMAEAKKQYEAENKKRVDEQRRLEKSKHVNTSPAPDVDSYSHVQAAQDAISIRKICESQEPAPMRQHYIGNNDCVPIDHSPSHSTSSHSHHSHSHQDHASFSCDTSSSSGSDSSSSSSSNSDF